MFTPKKKTNPWKLASRIGLVIAAPLLLVGGLGAVSGAAGNAVSWSVVAETLSAGLLSTGIAVASALRARSWTRPQARGQHSAAPAKTAHEAEMEFTGAVEMDMHPQAQAKARQEFDTVRNRAHAVIWPKVGITPPSNPKHDLN